MTLLVVGGGCSPHGSYCIVVVVILVFTFVLLFLSIEIIDCTKRLVGSLIPDWWVDF